MKHAYVFKLGTMTSATSTKKDGVKPSPREVHEEKVRYKIMEMLWASVHIARQEIITEIQTALSSCVAIGAASVSFDQAQANAVVEHDKMVDSLANVSRAVAAYRKSMGPQIHTVAHEMRWLPSVKSCNGTRIPTHYT